MFVEGELPDHVLRGIALSAITILWVILLVRCVGLRSFSKMTSFDFVATVATGSLLAGAAQAEDWMAFVQANAAMAGVFLTQLAVALLRQRSDKVEKALHNQPQLLMYEGEFIDDALRRTRVSRDDVKAKLREANVLDPAKVRAVVLETTGDVTVMHGDRLDQRLIDAVAGAPVR